MQHLEWHTGKDYNPTKEEVEFVKKVRIRREKMKVAKAKVERLRPIITKMYEADFVPYGDERSTSTVPLLRSIVEMFVAQAMKIPTEFIAKSETSEHWTTARAMQEVWKKDRRTKNRKTEIMMNEYTTGIYGSSAIFTWFERCEKKVKDVTIWDDWNIKEISKDYVEDNIILENVDIRFLYIDDQAIWTFESANDCIYEKWISYSKFKSLEWNKAYKNIDKVTPKNFSTEDMAYVTDEDTQREWEYVLLQYYWNLEEDEFWIVANGINVRKHAIMDTMNGKKAIPFTFRVLWMKLHWIRWVGFGEALMMFNSEVNNLREMLMDAIKRSNSQVLALWPWLSFNGREFVYDNEILSFDWQFSGNFEQISWNPPNQAIFNYIQQLYKDIAVYIGIDIQNIVWTPNRTAFEVEVQREASQERLNVYFRNRDLAFERLANLHMDNLQKFFPRKNADWLLPTVELDWEMLKDGELVKKKWKHILEITPEILRWQTYMDVHTNINATTISAVDRQQKMDFLKDVWQIANSYATVKQLWFDIDDILPFKTALTDTAQDYNITVDKKDNSEVEQKKKELFEWMRWMMKGWWQQQWTWQPWEQQEQPWIEQPQPLSPQWQPLI